MATSKMNTKVAVVGAGALGLIAMKNFKDDGFDVTGFESRPYVGGLWRDSNDSTISVVETTAFNSSKYRSAMSDFPFPEETDDYPTAPQLHKYLNNYSDHFGLTPRIRLGTKVIDLERVGDKWALKVQPQGESPRTELFDKVAIATGSLFIPKPVEFEGSEKFAGSVIHSIEYHGPQPYTNKNVLIIGIHASAQDVAFCLKDSATKVYMSHRSGLVLAPNYTADGGTLDQATTLRFLLVQAFLSTWFPRLWNWFIDRILSSISKQYFTTKPEWGFDDARSMAVSTPLMGDNLYKLLQSNFATPVMGIQRFVGPRSVLLTDGTELSDIDAIIQCTGYDFAVPFIPQSSPYQPYPKVGEPPHLYRNVFPLDPDPQVRNSLAFVGQVAVAHPGFVQYELLAQSISQIWLGHKSLPPLSKMKQWHIDYLVWRANQTRIYGFSSTFYTAFVPFADHIRWLDETSGSGIFAHFDWSTFNPRSWRLWWADSELYWLCMSGVFSPSIFRLFDCGGRKAWSEARTQIFVDNEAVKKQRERRLKEMEAEKKVKGEAEAKVETKINGVGQIEKGRQRRGQMKKSA